MKYLTLYNGLKMPLLGFGTARMNGEECYNAVINALECGYRHIDTAHMYLNEEVIGKAIISSNISRDELFITSKLCSFTNTYMSAKKRIDDMLKELQTSYVDLLLLHEPFEGDKEVYRAIEEAYNEGKAKSIGVSNFDVSYLDSFIKDVKIKPMVNQIECHPYFMQRELLSYLDKNDIKATAYAPLTQGLKNIFNEPILIELSNKYKKTIPQIILSYLMSLGIAVIPKSSHKERIVENYNVFDIELSKEDILKIAKLDEFHSLYEWY